MKTKEQILKWLKKQPWKGEFYEEAFNSREFPISYDIQFICAAFDWTNTKAGIHNWTKRNIDFQKWYDSNDKPMSWEEYCAQNPIKEGAYYLDGICQLQQTDPRNRNKITDINVMPKDLCEAFLAYMKLIQLRNAWVKGCDDNRNYKILVIDGEISVSSLPLCSEGLSFPTDDMANEFKDTFGDLLEIAKPLL